MGDECAKEKRYKPVTHVIFDMDGLLLDTETVYEQVFQKIADQYGKHYTHDIKQKVMGRGELDAATLAVSEMELPITVEDFLKQYHPMCKEALTRPSLMPVACPDFFVKDLTKVKNIL